MKLEARKLPNNGYFWVDNCLIRTYGHILKSTGIAIYNCLCVHAGKDQTCFPSQAIIARQIDADEKTVRKYMEILKSLRIIACKKIRRENGKWKNYTYLLVDKSCWLKPSEYIPYGTKRPLSKKPSVNFDPNGRENIPFNKTHRKKRNTSIEAHKLGNQLKNTHSDLLNQSG